MALWLTSSSSVFGVGYGKLAEVLTGNLPLKMLILLGLFKLAATVLSYGTGSSGGIFGPSLYIGGMLGGAMGTLTRLVFGGPATLPRSFALVGMGAVFAGVVRAPVTSIIMMFEMTDSYSMILPLMVANITSYVLASRLNPTPVYDALLLQDNIHLPHMERHVLMKMTVGSVMTRDVTTVPGDLTVLQAFDKVQQFPIHYNAYPLVDRQERLVGIFTFNDLKRAIAAGKSDLRLDQVMSRTLIHVHPDHGLDVAMLKLGRKGISQLPVVSRKDPQKLLGIITMHDVAAALSRDVENVNPGDEEDKEK